MAPKKKIIVLVGLMGCGKTRVGVELARLMNLPFVDSDKEIERAAGMAIPDIFERLGEPEFRRGEKKVMTRLLAGGDKVLATGGGAFIQADIRSEIKNKGLSVWLKAGLDTLVDRTSRTDHRPLLQGIDKETKLKELMDLRYPVYAEADVTVLTDGQTPFEMAKQIRGELESLGW